MIDLKVRADMMAASKAYLLTAEQSAKAMAKALNDTIREVRDAEKRLIAATINNPTRYTLNALWTEFANPNRLRARVWLKSTYSEHYLMPLIDGGQRRLKRFERRLVMTGYMQPGERAVPGNAAPRDAYGNVSRGLIQKILSQLRTAVVQGDYSNATNSKRSRAKRATVEYFASAGTSGQRRAFAGRKKGGALARTNTTQHLPRGIWERRRHGWGTSVRPVFLFVSQHRYSKILRFFEVADQIIKAKLIPNTDAAIARVLGDAGIGQKGGR